MAYSFAGPAALMMLLPLYLQCLLLVGEQSSRNRSLRLLLAMIAVPLSLVTPFWYHPMINPRERAVALNFAAGIVGPYGAMRGLEWGFARERYIWKGYSRQEDGRVPQGFARFQYALSLMCSMRMIGWQPTVARLPPAPPRPTSIFLRNVVGRILIYHVIGHLSAVAVTEAATTPGGMTKVLARILPYFRHLDQLSSVALALCLGQAAWAGMEVGQAVVTLIGWTLWSLLHALPLPSLVRPGPADPGAYPRLWFREPWEATSMSRFWTTHWHALFQRPFVAMGFEPARALFASFGRSSAYAAGLITVFSVSSVMHELGLAAATHNLPGFDYSQATYGRTSIFFMACGLVIVAETAFTRWTGRKVGGALGWVWTFSCLIALGTPLSEEWCIYHVR